MSASRRTLSFETLDDIVAEVQHLQKSGYEQAGKWNLGQVCGHLKYWMTYPMDGFPKPPVIIGAMLWLMKVTIGKRQFKSILANGFKAGGPTMPATVPPADISDDAQQAAEFLATVERFKDYSQPIHPSPLFGDMDYETAKKLQLLHCANHLGFLVPNDQ